MALFTEGKLFKKAGEGSGGGGGGDQHNLGWYATQAALEEAHPTATAGDWAIVGATDTVWIWDTDNSEWVDSDQKGQVTSVNGQTGDVVLDLLPSQTGNAGKFLTTDGTDASWSDKPLVNTATGTESLSIGGTGSTGNYNVNLGVYSQTSGSSKSYNVVMGYSATTGGLGFSVTETTIVGARSQTTGSHNTLIGYNTNTYGRSHCVAIGCNAIVNADNAALINCSSTSQNNYTANTFAFANSNNIYEVISADGTIPEARLADTTNAAQGQVLTLDANLNAVWQAGSGGGLPSQTGNAGKFLTTDGTDASWTDLYIKFQSSYDVYVGQGITSAGGYNNNVVVGGGSASRNNNGTAIGCVTQVGYDSIAIGYFADASTARTIQIGGGTNSEAGTMCVALENSNYQKVNYKLLDVDGTVPTDRLTKVNSTITLTAAGWSNGSQTVNVTGMTATGVVLVSPAPASAADYASAGIVCTAQGAGTLTFTCTTTPTNAITVNVVCL